MGVQSTDVFKQRVSQLMKLCSLSKKDMAQRLNVDYSTFWRKLNGQRNVDMELLKRIAEILGTSTAYLIGETDNPNPNTLLSAENVLDAEQETISFAYWGTVADNARNIAKSGDKDAIVYVSQMLKRALAFLNTTYKPTTSAIDKAAINMPLIVGDNNESNLTLGTA